MAPRNTLLAHHQNGYVPPQAPDVEEAVLGAILLEREKLNEVVGIIKSPDCFYVEANRIIFKAVCSLITAGSPVDLITVTNELRNAGQLEIVGGAYYVTRLTMSVLSSAHVEAHARIIVEKHILREIIRLGSEMMKRGYENSDDVFEIMGYSQDALYQLLSSNIKRDYVHAGTLVKPMLDNIHALRTVTNAITGVPSGFKELDSKLHGWQRTDLIILAARPAVGKTAFMLNNVLNGALQGHPQGVFSLEMGKEQLMKRLLAALAMIELESINQPYKLNAAELATLDACSLILSKLPIFIDDTPGLTIFEFTAKAKRMVGKHNVKEISLDYLQLMSGDAGSKQNREQQISQISRGLKIAAKEMEVPIIALSQLNRGVESRKENNSPQLSDLRESGAIEQDADIVMFLYRPSDEDLKKSELLQQNPNVASVSCAKNRNGSTFTIELNFLKSYQKWEDLPDAFALPTPQNPYAGMRKTYEPGQIVDDIPF